MIRLRILKQKQVRIPRRQIEKLFCRIIKAEAGKNDRGEINLVFTTDREIGMLNKTYRKKNKPTDVLSFKIGNQFGDSGIFGEIYISVETAFKQSREYGFALSQEILRLVCHGLLHLMGYDHIKAQERKKMETKERLYLNSTGLV